MFDNSASSDHSMGQIGQQLTPGMTVYDTHGHKLGTVDEFHEEWSYFCMRKGLIFHKELYVPLGTIASLDAQGVHLNITQDEMSGQQWSQPPVADDLGLSADERDERDLAGQSDLGETPTVRPGPEAMPLGQPPLESAAEVPGDMEDAGEVDRLNEPLEDDQGTTPPLY